MNKKQKLYYDSGFSIFPNQKAMLEATTMLQKDDKFNNKIINSSNLNEFFLPWILSMNVVNIRVKEKLLYIDKVLNCKVINSIFIIIFTFYILTLLFGQLKENVETFISFDFITVSIILFFISVSFINRKISIYKTLILSSLLKEFSLVAHLSHDNILTNIKQKHKLYTLAENETEIKAIEDKLIVKSLLENILLEFEENYKNTEFLNKIIINDFKLYNINLLKQFNTNIGYKDNFSNVFKLLLMET